MCEVCGFQDACGRDRGKYSGIHSFLTCGLWESNLYHGDCQYTTVSTEQSYQPFYGILKKFLETLHSHIKLFHKTSVINTMWSMHEDRPMEWNGELKIKHIKSDDPASNTRGRNGNFSK